MKLIKRITAFTITLALPLAMAPTALALAVTPNNGTVEFNALSTDSFTDGNGLAAFTKSEVVYAQLSAKGAPQDVYVVNKFDVTEDGRLLDFGAYHSTRNLSNDKALEQTGNITSVDAEKGVFYYQGNMGAAELPWKIDLCYLLNGAEISPDALAGASGELEMHISTQQNPAVDPAFFESFVMQITCTLPEDKTAGVASESGAIALAGSDTTVTFTVLPGHDGNLSCTADVHDFEMPGIQIAALPYTSDISMPDTEDMVGGLSQLADGTEQIATGSSTLATGMHELNNGASALMSGESGIQEGLNALDSSGKQLAIGSGAIKSALNGAAEAMASMDLSGIKELLALPDALEHIASTLDPETQQAQIGSLNALAQSLRTSLEKMDLEQLAALSDGLGKLASEYDAFDAGLNTYLEGVSALSSNYGQFSFGLASLSDGASQMASGADELASGARELSSTTRDLPNKMQSEVDAMLADYTFPEFNPTSFVSSNNANIDTVQFVITTTPIEKPAEAPNSAEDESEPTIWDRLLALFGI